MFMFSQGARSVEEEEQEEAREKSAAFRGTGFRLGDTEAPSQQIVGEPRVQKPEKVRPLTTALRLLNLTVCLCR